MGRLDEGRTLSCRAPLIEAARGKTSLHSANQVPVRGEQAESMGRAANLYAGWDVRPDSGWGYEGRSHSSGVIGGFSIRSRGQARGDGPASDGAPGTGPLPVDHGRRLDNSRALLEAGEHVGAARALGRGAGGTGQGAPRRRGRAHGRRTTMAGRQGAPRRRGRALGGRTTTSGEVGG